MESPPARSARLAHFVLPTRRARCRPRAPLLRRLAVQSPVTRGNGLASYSAINLRELKSPMSIDTTAGNGETHTRADLARLAFGVRGMTCASCVSHVESALTGVEGVTTASVNLATERARSS